MQFSKSLIIWIALLKVTVDAECPNGCSGHGDCMSKDHCNCWKNFQGNDCSDRTCLFSYAHVDTPRGDINMDQNLFTPGWILTNSQQFPAGTYEYFHPDAVTNEAHFYAECSNKGICDRTTGICQCLNGFEGSGCQRATCLGSCNGHGTCDSMAQLAKKAQGTLVGKEYPAGSVTYDLWDAEMMFGCRCDPWWHGPDCTKRSCRMGVDPMYLSTGTPIYETFVVHAYVATGAITNMKMKIRMFDYHGESYLTAPITVLDDSVLGNDEKNAAAIQRAILELPNQAFTSVNCEPVGLVGGELVGFQSTRLSGSVGLSVVCVLGDSPGPHRIPEIESIDDSVQANEGGYIVTTSHQGQLVDWFTRSTNYIVDTVADDGATPPIYTITLTAQSDTPAGADFTNKFFKVGPHILRAVSVAGKVITIEGALHHTIATGEPIFLPNTGNLFTIVADATTGTIAVGSDTITFGAIQTIATGGLIFFENQFFNVQELSDNGTPTVPATEWYAKLDKPFGGTSLDGTAFTAKAVWKVTLPADASQGYTYVSECSGRGLCNTENGICTCFKGYTNDNCDRQNILAV